VAASFRDRPEIVVPKVYWDWTSERVNVQQYIDGTPSREPEALAAAGLDRAVLAHRGAQAMLKMVLEDGFFHADPHPGNVFYLPGNRVAFIDFGMAGHLSERRRDELVRLLDGLVGRDAEGVVDILLEWAGAAQVDSEKLASDVPALDLVPQDLLLPPERLPPLRLVGGGELELRLDDPAVDDLLALAVYGVAGVVEEGEQPVVVLL
jgi:ubiquinone biosynthesis protein